MFFELLKNKIFWYTWILLAIVGMFIGLYLSSKWKEDMLNSNKCHANIFGKYETIFVLWNADSYLDEYLNYFENPKQYEYLPFPLNGLAFDQEVFVLDTIMDGKIMEISYYSKRTYGNQYTWKNAYIYFKYLDNCGSASPDDFQW